MSGTTDPVPLSNHQQISARIAELQKALQTAAPNYESLLFTIHQTLVKDPDIAHLLTEEEVGVIVAGLSKKKNIIIASPTASGGGGKKGKKFDLEDLV